MDIVARCNFPARLDSLLNSLEFVSACARAKGFSARRISEVRLAAEEALVNIFRYAYPEGSGEVEIICRFDSRERLVIELIDCGIPFDVLSVPEPKLTGGIEDRAAGGLGVHLMKTLMDGVHYSRKEGKNILTLFASREGRSRS